MFFLSKYLNILVFIRWMYLASEMPSYSEDVLLSTNTCFLLDSIPSDLCVHTIVFAVELHTESLKHANLIYY